MEKFSKIILGLAISFSLTSCISYTEGSYGADSPYGNGYYSNGYYYAPNTYYGASGGYYGNDGYYYHPNINYYYDSGTPYYYGANRNKIYLQKPESSYNTANETRSFGNTSNNGQGGFRNNPSQNNSGTREFKNNNSGSGQNRPTSSSPVRRTSDQSGYSSKSNPERNQSGRR